MTDCISSLETLINTCRKVTLQVNYVDNDILLWCLELVKVPDLRVTCIVQVRYQGFLGHSNNVLRDTLYGCHCYYIAVHIFAKSVTICVWVQRRTGNLWDGELGSCKIREHLHRMRLRIIFHVVFAFLENSNYIQVQIFN